MSKLAPHSMSMVVDSDDENSDREIEHDPVQTLLSAPMKVQVLKRVVGFP